MPSCDCVLGLNFLILLLLKKIAKLSFVLAAFFFEVEKLPVRRQVREAGEGQTSRGTFQVFMF
jgi:hypothetical protein